MNPQTNYTYVNNEYKNNEKMNENLDEINEHTSKMNEGQILFNQIWNFDKQITKPLFQNSMGQGFKAYTNVVLVILDKKKPG